MRRTIALAGLIAVILTGGLFLAIRTLSPPAGSRKEPSEPAAGSPEIPSRVATGVIPPPPAPETVPESERPPAGQRFLRGIARDRTTEAPLAGVDVRVSLRSGTRSETRAVVTGPKGEFRMALSPGSYSATFETGSHRPARAEFTLAEDRPPALVEVSFERGIPAEGMVLDREGNPAPGVALEWIRSEGGGRREAESDDRGTFRIGGLEAGSYAVSLAPALLRSAGKVGTAKVAVTERGPNRFDLRADVGRSLAVEIAGTDGLPARGAQVRFEVVVAGRAISGFLPPADEAGRTRMPGLPSGCGTLVLEAPPGPAGTARVEVDPAALPEAVRIVLRPVPAVEGLAVDEEGRPLEGAQVSVLDAGGKVLAAARTDASGRFRLHGVPPGRLRIRAVAPGPGLGAVADLQLPPPTPDLVTISLTKRAAIAGIVRERDGRPVAGARVTLSGPAGIEETSTSREGKFAFAAQGGKGCRLAASAEGFLAPAALDAVEPDNPVDLVLGRGATVRGRIVLPDGRPLRSGADLVVSGLPARSPEPRARVESDGAFAIEGLIPGKFRLKATGPDFALALSDEIEVPDGGTIEGAAVRALDGPHLDVRAVDAKGAAIPGVILSISGRGDRSPVAVTRSCDGRGMATFPLLPEGGYALRADAAGYRETVVEIEWSRSVSLPFAVKMVGPEAAENPR
jgi:hypothetical protein